MIDLLATLSTGIDMPTVALTINRIAVGTFFAISGYHKLFNAARHKSLVATLKADNIPYTNAMCWFVPSVELSAGLGVAVGCLSALAALGLVIVCAVATLTDGVKRVAGYAPIDRADVLDDYLYLPEMLYILLLMVVILAGPGPLSFDHFIFWLFS